MSIIPLICNEETALRFSVLYPDLVFYTDDTGRVVKGGHAFSDSDVTQPLSVSGNSMSLMVKQNSGFGSDGAGLYVNAFNLTDELFNDTLNEADALTDSLLNQGVLYLTTDTSCVVKNGVKYGKGLVSSTAFAFADDTTGQANWDTTKYYLVNTSTSGVFDMYVYDGSWYRYGNQELTMVQKASEITYALTNTPILGDGDVQSAIEALDEGFIPPISKYSLTTWSIANKATHITTNIGFEVGKKYRIRLEVANSSAGMSLYLGVNSTTTSDYVSIGNIGSGGTLIDTTYTPTLEKNYQYPYTWNNGTATTGKLDIWELDTSGNPIYVWDGLVPKWVEKGGIDTNGGISSTDGNYRTLVFSVSGGETLKLRNMSPWANTASICWAVYSSPPTSANVTPSGFISSASDPDTRMHRQRNYALISADITLPYNARCLAVMCRITDNGSYFTQQGLPYVMIRKKINRSDIYSGYKISGWIADRAIGTSVHVGSKLTGLDDTTYPRYGCRTVRLYVNKGDVVLADICSMNNNTLIFTDENSIVVERYVLNRQFGLFTAPCDGELYMNDILWRDNYIFPKDYAVLAKQLYAKKKEEYVTGDYYNAFAPKLVSTLAPFSATFTATADGGPQFYAITNGNLSNLTTNSILTWCQPAYYKNTIMLVAYHYIIHDDTTCAGSFTQLYQGTQLHYMRLSSDRSLTLKGGGWEVDIKGYSATAGGALGFGLWTASVKKNDVIHISFDKLYIHPFDNFKEAVIMGEKIIRGDVEVDNFNGIQIKGTNDPDVWFISAESVAYLGYDVIKYGALLPLGAGGFAKAKEMYKTTKTLTGSAKNKYLNDTHLYYYPYINVSAVTNAESMFRGCSNLRCVGDLNLACEMNYLFDQCSNLEAVGDISIDNTKTCSVFYLFQNCVSLRRVGRIECKVQSTDRMFYSCRNLRHIESVNIELLSSIPYSSGHYMFSECYRLTHMTLKNLGTPADATTLNLQNLTAWGFNPIYDLIAEEPDSHKSLFDSLYTYSFDRAGSDTTAFNAYTENAVGTAIGIYESDALPETAEDGDLALVTGSADVMVYSTANSEWSVSVTASDGDVYITNASARTAYAFDGTNTAWVQWTHAYPNCTINLSANSYNSLSAVEKEQIIGKGYILTSN